ncbi:MAG: tRNA uridine-5-carboxymethylaminomethyl(34) synthesis GTPase MnmE [Thioalkalispiraceae bacterium]|jgi:tRNA modification GTPase
MTVNPDHIETIAALATPAGRGGVGIVRVSGPLAITIAEQILGHCPKPRLAEYLPFKNAEGEVIDQGIALYFPGPHSFTGEDVLELQGHGGPVVMDMLLHTVIHFGARLARSGEFSERAFLNDKLDLTQAEAIADLIDAGSAQAARTAMRSLQGAFSTAVHNLVQQVTELRVYVEAAMDFPDEEIDFISEGQVSEKIADQQQILRGIFEQAQQGSLIREGINLVLVGRPNAGKSSLLNSLARREAAIVTDIPGTTRDIVKEVIMLDGLPVHLLDTAGLRETQDRVELEGMRRTWDAINQSDVMILLVDDSEGFGEAEQRILDQCPESVAVIVLYNKCDITGRQTGIVTDSLKRESLAISARSGEGIEDLIVCIKQLAGMQASGEGAFMARRRHLSELKTAEKHLLLAQQQAQNNEPELIAEELKMVQEALGQITGEVTSDDLLGKIFSEFCIGK